MAEDGPVNEAPASDRGSHNLLASKRRKIHHGKSASIATIGDASTMDQDLAFDEIPDYPRRRAMIACEICRSRKSKCDGSRPKCKLCIDLNAACVYREPGVKLDAGDKIILDRLANIEALIQSKFPTLSQADSSTAGPLALPAEQGFNMLSPTTSHTASDYVNSRRTVGNGPGSIPLSGFGISQAAMNISTMPKAHTTPALHLLQWPCICDLVTSPCDPQVLLQLEMTRPPLDLRSHYPLDLSDLCSSIYTRAFFGKVNVWYAVVNPHSWNELYRTASLNSFRSGPESCVVLLVFALGQAAHTDTSTAHASYDGRPPGTAYFEAAWQLLPTLMLRNNVMSAQCHILAAAYLLYLVRPLEAWNLLCSVSIKLQLLLSSSSPLPSDEARNLLERIYWNTLMFESDLLAELDLPHSGIVQFEESMPLPRSFPLTPISPSPSSSAPAPSPGSDEIWYFLAEIALRRLLNRVSHLLYSKSLSLASLAPLVTELDLQLTQWHNHLPPSVQFPIRPSSSLPDEALDPVQTVLRLRYHACRTIIHRPYILYVLSSATPTVGNSTSHIFEACATGLESAYIQISLLSSHRAGHVPYLYQGFLSLVSQTLLLLGASLHTELRRLMPVRKEALVKTVDSVRIELNTLGRLAPSLEVSGGILGDAVDRWKERISGVEW
ncbi:unnamed protein product [Zymoseptoria tritici ST99CH_3D1]|nr:unnamed protein product [Zymoseptoria tritici ST99CH_3D1]